MSDFNIYFKLLEKLYFSECTVSVSRNRSYPIPFAIHFALTWLDSWLVLLLNILSNYNYCLKRKKTFDAVISHPFAIQFAPQAAAVA